MTCGNSAAQIAPWGAGKLPPMGPANPWTAPRPALARARPPYKLARDMSSRADLFWPLATASRNERAARRMPSTHNTSVMGLAREEVNGSINVLGERIEPGAGGDSRRQIVREVQDQRSPTAASIKGLRRLTFTLCSGEASTALRVTFRAGASRGGNGDERNGRLGESLPLSDDFAGNPAAHLCWPAWRRWLWRRPIRCRRRARRSHHTFPERASARPRCTVAISGSPATEKVVVATPAAFRLASNFSAHAGLLPVTVQRRGGQGFWRSRRPATVCPRQK